MGVLRKLVGGLFLGAMMALVVFYWSPNAGSPVPFPASELQGFLAFPESMPNLTLIVLGLIFSGVGVWYSVRAKSLGVGSRPSKSLRVRPSKNRFFVE